MRVIRKLLPYATAGVVMAALYVAWVFGSRWLDNRRLERAARDVQRAEAAKTLQQVYGDGRLRILNFYVTPGSIGVGQEALLCYGVANAKTLRLDPPVAYVYPALSRCFDVAPRVETRYTLTAEDSAGHSTSESLVIHVK